MNLAHLMLTGHILSVVAWVGGAIMMQVLAARARAASPEKLYDFAKDAAWLGNRFFMPASVLTLAFGLATATTELHTFGLLWIKLGLLGWFLTALNGGAVLGRLSRKMKNLGEQHGPTDANVQAASRKLLAAMNIDLVIVILVIADMVFKPT